MPDKIFKFNIAKKPAIVYGKKKIFSSGTLSHKKRKKVRTSTDSSDSFPSLALRQSPFESVVQKIQNQESQDIILSDKPDAPRYKKSDGSRSEPGNYKGSTINDKHKKYYIPDKKKKSFMTQRTNDSDFGRKSKPVKIRHRNKNKNKNKLRIEKISKEQYPVKSNLDKGRSFHLDLYVHALKDSLIRVDSKVENSPSTSPNPKLLDSTKLEKLKLNQPYIGISNESIPSDNLSTPTFNDPNTISTVVDNKVATSIDDNSSDSDNEPLYNQYFTELSKKSNLYKLKKSRRSSFLLVTPRTPSATIKERKNSSDVYISIRKIKQGVDYSKPNLGDSSIEVYDFDNLKWNFSTSFPQIASNAHQSKNADIGDQRNDNGCKTLSRLQNLLITNTIPQESTESRLDGFLSASNHQEIQSISDPGAYISGSLNKNHDIESNLLQPLKSKIFPSSVIEKQASSIDSIDIPVKSSIGSEAKTLTNYIPQGSPIRTNNGMGKNSSELLGKISSNDPGSYMDRPKSCTVNISSLNLELMITPTSHYAKTGHPVSTDKSEDDWGMGSDSNPSSDEDLFTSITNQTGRKMTKTNDNTKNVPLSGPLIRLRGLKNISYTYGGRVISDTKSSESLSSDINLGEMMSLASSRALANYASGEDEDHEKILWNRFSDNTTTQKAHLLTEKNESAPTSIYDKIDSRFPPEKSKSIQAEINILVEKLTITAGTRKFNKSCLKLVAKMVDFDFCKVMGLNHNLIKIFKILSTELQKKEYSEQNRMEFQIESVTFLLLMIVLLVVNPRSAYELILQHRALERVSEIIVRSQSIESDVLENGPSDIIHFDKASKLKLGQIYTHSKQTLEMLEKEQISCDLSVYYLSIKLLYSLTLASSPAAIVMNDLIRRECCASGCLGLVSDLVWQKLVPSWVISNSSVSKTNDAPKINLYDENQAEPHLQVLKMGFEFLEYVTLELVSDAFSETSRIINQTFELSSVIPLLVSMISLTSAVFASCYHTHYRAVDGQVRIPNGHTIVRDNSSFGCEFGDKVLLLNDILLSVLRFLLNFTSSCDEVIHILVRSGGFEALCRLMTTPRLLPTVLYSPDHFLINEPISTFQKNQGDDKAADFQLFLSQQYHDILLLVLSIFISAIESKTVVANTICQIKISRACEFRGSCAYNCNCLPLESFVIVMCDVLYCYEKKHPLQNHQAPLDNKSYHHSMADLESGEPLKVNSLKYSQNTQNTSAHSLSSDNSNSVCKLPTTAEHKTKRKLSSFMSRILQQADSPLKLDGSPRRKSLSTNSFRYAHSSMLRSHLMYFLSLIFKNCPENQLLAKKSLSNPVYSRLFQLLSTVR